MVVPDVGALGPGDDRNLVLGVVAAHPREVHPEVLAGRLLQVRPRGLALRVHVLRGRDCHLGPSPCPGRLDALHKGRTSVWSAQPRFRSSARRPRLYACGQPPAENWDICAFARLPLSEIVPIRLGFRGTRGSGSFEEELRKHQAQLTADGRFRRQPQVGDQAVRRFHRGGFDRPRHPRGRVLHAARTERLRQDDDPADDRRLRAAGRGRDPDRRRRRRRPARLTSARPTRSSRATRSSRTSASRRTSPTASSARRSARPRAEQRVQAELERVGLWGEANRRPNQLSGGQQQRVALARAVVNLPKVLLLDEPLGALDLKLRKGLQVELKRIQQEIGITFVYVTHDQEEALTMSDRIAVMNRGIVEQIADPGRGLRAAGDDLRRRLHRRLEPDAGHGPIAERRPRDGRARGRASRSRATPTASRPASGATPSSGPRSST